MNLSLKAKFRKITTFIFDVDGVLTDGTVTAFGSGELVRTFNVKDGYAIGISIRSGYRVAIISGGRDESIRERLKPFGVKDIFLGVKTDKKLEVFTQYLADNNLTEEEILYIGDDLPDIEVLQTKVLACCPADAVSEIQGVVNYIAKKNGGKGCVREIIEIVMKEQNTWMKIL